MTIEQDNFLPIHSSSAPIATTLSLVITLPNSSPIQEYLIQQKRLSLIPMIGIIRKLTSHIPNDGQLRTPLHDALTMMSQSYEDQGGTPPESWRVARNVQEIGYQATAYINPLKGVILLANRGTHISLSSPLTTLVHLADDLLIATGLPPLLTSSQAKNFAISTEKIARILNFQLEVAGHSRGASLGLMQALLTNNNAIFADSVNNQKLAKHLGYDFQNINGFVASNEFKKSIITIQGTSNLINGVGSPVGKVIYVDSLVKDGSLFSRLMNAENPVEFAAFMGIMGVTGPYLKLAEIGKKTLSAHSIDNIRDAFSSAYPVKTNSTIALYPAPESDTGRNPLTIEILSPIPQSNKPVMSPASVALPAPEVPSPQQNNPFQLSDLTKGVTLSQDVITPEKIKNDILKNPPDFDPSKTENASSVHTTLTIEDNKWSVQTSNPWVAGGYFIIAQIKDYFKSADKKAAEDIHTKISQVENAAHKDGVWRASSAPIFSVFKTLFNKQGYIDETLENLKSSAQKYSDLNKNNSEESLLGKAIQHAAETKNIQDLCARDFNSMIAKYVAFKQQLYEKAVNLINQGDNKSALKITSTLVKDLPDDPGVLIAHGLASADIGLPTAIDILLQAKGKIDKKLEKFSDSEIQKMQQGTFLSNGEVGELLKQDETIYNSLVSMHSQLTEATTDSSTKTTAQTKLLHWVTERSNKIKNNISYQRDKVNMYVSLGKVKEALAEQKALCERAEKTSADVLELANLYELSQDADAAKKTLFDHLKKSPYDKSVQQKAITTLLQDVESASKEEVILAIQFQENICDSTNRDSVELHRLAIFYVKVNEISKAMSVLTEYHEKNPDDITMTSYLMQQLHLQKDSKLKSDFFKKLSDNIRKDKYSPDAKKAYDSLLKSYTYDLYTQPIPKLVGGALVLWGSYQVGSILGDNFGQWLSKKDTTAEEQAELKKLEETLQGLNHKKVSKKY